MTPEALKEAIAEAKRFIKVAEKVSIKRSNYNPKVSFLTGPKETGAARRASMDLTRKLAELRGSK